MKQLYVYLRKLIILVIGLPVIVLGVILIPLPGPGLLVVFAGLFILSYEFEWAQKYRKDAQERIVKIIEQARGKR